MTSSFPIFHSMSVQERNPVFQDLAQAPLDTIIALQEDIRASKELLEENLRRQMRREAELRQEINQTIEAIGKAEEHEDLSIGRT